jgi:hypothetical protein
MDDVLPICPKCCGVREAHYLTCPTLRYTGPPLSSAYEPPEE